VEGLFNSVPDMPRFLFDLAAANTRTPSPRSAAIMRWRHLGAVKSTLFYLG
jgi:hypothetical protein